MFKPATIQLSNGNDFSITNHPFTIGVPCAQGTLTSERDLCLVCKGRSRPFHVTRLAKWPDGSIKWLLLDFQISLSAHEQTTVQLTSDKIADGENHLHDDKPDPIRKTNTDAGYEIDTGCTQFTIGGNTSGFFRRICHNGLQVLKDNTCEILLVDEHGITANTIISAISFDETGNTLRAIANIDGYFQNSKNESLAEFWLRLTFYAGSSTVKCEFTLRNPHAAEHPGGVWDLGDSNSFLFKELSIKIDMPEADEYTSAIRLTPEAEWRLTQKGNATLEQNSSGGENWNSTNHMNSKGDVPLEYKGFRYSENNEQKLTGDRATPCFHMSSDKVGIGLFVVDFWQNFPKAIRLEKTSLLLGLFPASYADIYELQGGERKKHTFYLDFGNDRDSLDSYIHEVTPQIPLGYYAESGVVPWLPPTHEDTDIQQLIDRGIQGEHNFFEKRETIDEYGWRNYGEIFADHEILEYKGNDEFISHYNNQYDPLYGFIKQYLISGDRRWYELLTSLAQHIADIDIYHTKEDRDEYNGGLFWHTHHYLTAFTCTHRTFSHKHADDFLYGEIGGGPGEEHCYTTGLGYYYFMTGDEVYKDAALEVVNWITRVFEGSDTVIERVFQFKSKELPIIKRLIAGETVQRYKYPFTRGTGNYITSLIDAYNLTGKREFILNIERVIRQSVHPLDDISLRNLTDTEASWSYLVHLQAVCKYLHLKISMNEIDDTCIYAKDSLLHYVDWMLNNESPFLENPDDLEYPNHTWTAQDLRKAYLFYVASLYSEDNRNAYIDAAHHYVRYVADTLKDEETRHYARILILLMQNDIHESGLNYESSAALRNPANAVTYTSAPLYSITGIIAGFIKDVIYRMARLSITNEKRWLSFRIK